MGSGSAFMTARLFKSVVLGALLTLAGVATTEILFAAGLRPLSPLGWSGAGVLVGALLGGLPAALAGAAVAASYTALHYAAPHRFAEFFGNPINTLAWVIGLGLLAALCVWLRSRLDRLQSAEQVIRDSEARFRALFDLSPDAIIVHSGSVVLYVNAAALKLFGATRQEAIVGLEANCLTFPESLPERQERLDFLLANPGASIPFADRKYRRLDGTPMDVEVAAYSYVERGAIRVVLLARDITERKRAEQALASAKERLQRAMEGSNLSLWDTDLRTGEVFLSEGWADLLGEPAGDTRTTVDGLMKRVHPADLAPIVQLSKEAIQGKRDAYVTEHRVRTRSGDWKWIRSTGRVSGRDAAGRALRMTGTNREITERKLAELALRESEERFRSLTSMSSDWYWEQDESFRFKGMSGQLLEKTGIAHEAHLGKTRWEMPAPNVTEGEWQRHRAQLERHEPFVNFVMRRPDTDGRAHWVSISGEPIFDELKRFRGYRGVGHDVTAEHLARERIERMNVELEERVRLRTAELEALVKELETFNYAVAHDLHTSLGVMSVNAGMLLNDLGGQLAEDHRRALGRIAGNAELTVKLLDDLVEYARLGRQTLERVPVVMRPLVNDAWRQLARAETDRQLSFEAGELPGCAGDKRMLEQLWTRLISNALKYTRTREQARVEAGYSAAQQAYFVRDNGVGFDMRHADKLFGLFERLHRDERFEGTGVGLALAARIVRRHGGRIWAEARPEEGATFWFSLSGG